MEIANRRTKQTEIRDSGTLVPHIWHIFHHDIAGHSVHLFKMPGHTAGRRENLNEIWDLWTLETHAWDTFGLARLMAISELLDALVIKWSATRKSNLSVRLNWLAIEQNGLQFETPGHYKNIWIIHCILSTIVSHSAALLPVTRTYLFHLTHNM